MANNRVADVAVVGAGISGLAAAHNLRRAGLDVCVIEQSDRAGGTIETARIDDFLVDYGPNSGLDTSPLLGRLFDEAGVATDVVYANERAKSRYIVKHGDLHALPMSPPAFLRTSLFSGGAKLALLKEPFVRPSDPDSDESLAAFVQRRLGREFLDYAINPFVSGVYAGVPEKLSVRAGFPKLFELEQRYGSLIKGAIKGARERKKRAKAGEVAKSGARMFSFRDGMQTVVDALARELGDTLVTGATPAAISSSGDGYELVVHSGAGEWGLTCRAVVLAIPAHAYPTIEFEMGFTPAEALANITYPPVSVVFFGYAKGPRGRDLDGFGFLVPEKERRQILGTIWSSSIFANRAPGDGAALTTFVGGARQPENARLGHAALTNLVRRELRDLIGIETAPDLVEIRLWDRAIPQYNVGHVKIVEAIDSFERRTPGIFISGNFRGGVSLSDCVQQARRMSDRVAAHLGVDEAPVSRDGQPAPTL